MSRQPRRHQTTRLGLEQLEDRCTPATFSNPTAINIPDENFALSDIQVSGLVGTVTRVTVTLLNVTHTYPRDLDIALIANNFPFTRVVTLMSDVGDAAGTDATNLVLTFDDAATGAVPIPPASGTFGPTNIQDGSIERFLIGGDHPAMMSVFNGMDPNRVWTLNVGDDFAGDTGSIAGGWILNIETAIQTTTEVTAMATVTSGKLQVRGKRARQSVTVTNTSGASYAGLVSLLLTGLKRKIKVVGQSGTTAVFSPGNPFVSLTLGGDGDLDPGESITFNLVFKNPTGRRFRFTPFVVAGLGTL